MEHQFITYTMTIKSIRITKELGLTWLTEVDKSIAMKAGPNDTANKNITAYQLSILKCCESSISGSSLRDNSGNSLFSLMSTILIITNSDY